MTAPTKTPIDPSEIRAGDTIERHWMGTVMTMPVARLSAKGGLAYSPEGYCVGLTTEDGEKFFLLDRPVPPVSLPTEPTLGWLTWYAGEESSGLGAHRTLLGIYHRMGNGDITDEAAAGAWGAQDVIAFTRATAVPIEALDRLRSDVADWPPMSPNSVLGRFLAAVDEATS